MDQIAQEPSVRKVSKKAEFSRLSKDGKWKSFEKAPNLLQYVPSGVYYARVKIGGKLFRESLETKVWTSAKLKLADFVKEKREPKIVSIPDSGMLVEAAIEEFKTQLAQKVSMKQSSKDYRLLCIKKLKSSWPELMKKPVGEVAPEECNRWAAQLSKEIASQYFNNVVSTLQMVLQTGVDDLKERTGKKIENAADELTKARILPRLLKLPEPSQFWDLIVFIQKQNSWGRAAAELVEFLAYSGTRLYTEAQWVTWEDVNWTKREIVVRGDPQTHTKNWDARRIPILPNMDELLTRMKDDRGSPLSGKILRIVECPETLKKACPEIKIAPMRHHDLRHLFATRCIESGVDIPTVARWLGHRDGGALAMRTYGHLRNEHSQSMAAKVHF
jgi:integrase